MKEETHAQPENGVHTDDGKVLAVLRENLGAQRRACNRKQVLAELLCTTQ